MKDTTKRGCPITLHNQPIPGIAGPANEFNYNGGIQAAFPFQGPKSNISQDTGEPIRIFKQDGSVVGSYQNSIIRPLDDVHLSKKTTSGEDCSWPCYSGDKYQKWCNDDNAVNYYAMRPLVTPDTYNGWLTNMFNYLIKPGHEATKLLTAELVPKIFCTPTVDNYGSEETVVMKWLMTNIAMAVNNIPQLQNNGPWRKEEFHHTDVQFYSFGTTVGGNESSVYKIIFNLYNPLRSTSTLVECVILNNGNEGKYTIASMNFVNSGEWKDSNENLSQGMQGYNLSRPGQDLQINLNSAKLPTETHNEWNYGNTLVLQKFNEFGFYEPLNNIKVDGGVPDSLAKQLKHCENSMLMNCETPKYSGYKMDKRVPINGLGHMVNDNPSLIYKDFPDSQPKQKNNYKTVDVYT